MSSQKEVEMRMLEKVGVLPKKSSFMIGTPALQSMFQTLSFFLRPSIEEGNPLVKRIERLERTVEELKGKKEMSARALWSEVDRVYLKFKGDLEKHHYGKIVAIDVESEKIVGIGNSILEAYYEAKKKASKEKFSYRRVGVNFEHRL